LPEGKGHQLLRVCGYEILPVSVATLKISAINYLLKSDTRRDKSKLYYPILQPLRIYDILYYLMSSKQGLFQKAFIRLLIEVKPQIDDYIGFYFSGV
jgi:hypothetical protein